MMSFQLATTPRSMRRSRSSVCTPSGLSARSRPVPENHRHRLGALPGQPTAQLFRSPRPPRTMTLRATTVTDWLPGRYAITPYRPSSRSMRTAAPDGRICSSSGSFNPAPAAQRPQHHAQHPPARLPGGRASITAAWSAYVATGGPGGGAADGSLPPMAGTDGVAPSSQARVKVPGTHSFSARASHGPRAAPAPAHRRAPGRGPRSPSAIDSAAGLDPLGPITPGRARIPTGRRAPRWTAGVWRRSGIKLQVQRRPVALRRDDVDAATTRIPASSSTAAVPVEHQPDRPVRRDQGQQRRPARASRPGHGFGPVDGRQTHTHQACGGAAARRRFPASAEGSRTSAAYPRGEVLRQVADEPHAVADALGGQVVDGRGCRREEPARRGGPP